EEPGQVAQHRAQSLADGRADVPEAAAAGGAARARRRRAGAARRRLPSRVAEAEADVLRRPPALAAERDRRAPPGPGARGRQRRRLAGGMGRGARLAVLRTRRAVGAAAASVPRVLARGRAPAPRLDAALLGRVDGGRARGRAADREPDEAVRAAP